MESVKTRMKNNDSKSKFQGTYMSGDQINDSMISNYGKRHD